MPDIDLYAIHRLERRQSPTEMAAQLTSELNDTDPRDQLTRSRIETARVILGDPERRARYDRQLDDPAAPEITEATLAQLAGRPAPTAPRKALSRPVAALVAITAVVAVIALVGIIVAVTSGDDHTSKSASASNAGSAPASATPGPSDEERGCNCRLPYAEWDTGATPRAVIQLEKAYELPPAVTTALQQCTGDRCSLKQYQDKNVGVQINTNTPGVDNVMVAIYDQNGQLVSFKQYPQSGDVPKSFDLQKDARQGYYRIATRDVEIPAEAHGTEDEMNYATWILPDAFDETVIWVLLRGGKYLYKAYLHSGS